MIKLYRPLRVALVNSTLPLPYSSYGDHWRDGFIDAGLDVTEIPYDDIPLIPPRYDLYFFVEIRYHFSVIPWYLNPRVLYSWDSHVLGTDPFEQAAKVFDKILLASKLDVESLWTKGITNVAWVPEACNPRVHKNLHQDRPVLLGYVGQSNGTIFRNDKTKDDFMKHLTDGPYHLQHRHNVWGHDYTEAINQIQVMFDRTIMHNIGTRIFEASAAGCVPLWSKTNYQTGIDELMNEGVHYQPYNDTIEGLDSVLSDLFNNSDKMKKIAYNAEKHVLANHTYAHRVGQVLKELGIKHMRTETK
jgi:hypothetical protein